MEHQPAAAWLTEAACLLRLWARLRLPLLAITAMLWVTALLRIATWLLTWARLPSVARLAAPLAGLLRRLRHRTSPCIAASSSPSLVWTPALAASATYLTHRSG